MCCLSGWRVCCETGANGPNLTPNFGTQGEKSGLGWSQIWTQFDGNFRPRPYNEAADLIYEKGETLESLLVDSTDGKVLAQRDKCLI